MSNVTDVYALFSGSGEEKACHVESRAGDYMRVTPCHSLPGLSDCETGSNLDAATRRRRDRDPFTGSSRPSVSFSGFFFPAPPLPYSL